MIDNFLFHPSHSSCTRLKKFEYERTSDIRYKYSEFSVGVPAKWALVMLDIQLRRLHLRKLALERRKSAGHLENSLEHHRFLQ